MTDTRSPLDRFLDFLMMLAVHAVEKVVVWFTAVSAEQEATA